MGISSMELLMGWIVDAIPLKTIGKTMESTILNFIANHWLQKEIERKIEGTNPSKCIKMH